MNYFLHHDEKTGYLNNEKRDTLLTICCFLFLIAFLFQRGFVDKFAPISYLDEGFALLLFPLAVFLILMKRFYVPVSRVLLFTTAFLAFYWLMGWMGVFIHHFQPLRNTLMDSFVGLKFFFAIGSAYLLFSLLSSFRDFYEKLYYLVNGCTAFLTLLTLADMIFDLYYDETRFGFIPIIRLFYYHYTDLVAVCLLLACIYLRLYEFKGDAILKWLLMLSFIVLMTSRTKGFAAMMIAIAIYLFLQKKMTLNLVTRIITAVIVLASLAGVLYKAYWYYFVLKYEAARYVLSIAGPFLANTYFPFGTGWATFGSHFSIEPYSPVYTTYGINQVWGLSPDYPEFISDTFWPMILGQCGYFGLIAYALAIFLMCAYIYSINFRNKNLFYSAAMVMIYNLIASTSESAFVGTSAVMFAFWLGLLFAEFESSKKRRLKPLRLKNPISKE